MTDHTPQIAPDATRIELERAEKALARAIEEVQEGAAALTPTTATTGRAANLATRVAELNAAAARAAVLREQAILLGDGGGQR